MHDPLKIKDCTYLLINGTAPAISVFFFAFYDLS